jgi:hypothetical protein
MSLTLNGVLYPNTEIEIGVASVSIFVAKNITLYY